MKNGNAARWFLAGTAVVLLLGLTTDQIMNNVYDSSSTALRANIVNASGTPVAFSIVQGSTAISNGTDKHVLFQDGAVVGEDAGLQYDKATETLTVDNGTVIGAATDGGTAAAPGLQVGPASRGGFFSYAGPYLQHSLGDTTGNQGWDIGIAAGKIQTDLFSTTGAWNLAVSQSDATSSMTTSGSFTFNIPVSSVLTFDGSGSGSKTVFKGPLYSVIQSDAAPTAGSCGVTPAITSGSTDTAGEITAGSGALATCVVNFGAAYVGIPVCTVVPRTAVANFAVNNDASTLTITGAVLTSIKFAWICIGKT